MFDHDRLLAFALDRIERFAAEHSSETFYAFAIDAALLCLNSVERYDAMLAGFEKRGRLSDEERAEVRADTGDWSYQGFAVMTAEHGFDERAYQEHYAAPDDEQPFTEYGRAMDRLVAALVDKRAFAYLRTTEDFYATRVEHSY